MDKELKISKTLALEAGKKILEFYDKEIKVTNKIDNSPVTQADLAANEIIRDGLIKEFPDYGLLTEEDEDNPERLTKERVWIVDPLDGTKEFISKNGEFTVNIALVERGEPIIGVIYIPAKDELFFAVKDKGSFFEKDRQITKLHVSQRNDIQDMTLIRSRSHATEKELALTQKYDFAKIVSAGSALKGCLVAKGDADVYFRFGSTNEWDICAMDCIIREAKGLMTDLDGNLLKYNKPHTIMEGFLVSNNTIHRRLLDL